MCNNHGNNNHGEHDGHGKGPEPVNNQKSIKVLFEQYKEKGMNEAIYNEVAAIRALPQSEHDQVIARLEKLVHQYPDVASLQSSLGYMYELNKEIEKAEGSFKDALAAFPDDIIVRTAYAGFLLRRGNFDAVPDLFNKTFDMGVLYPERDTFYALEVLEFYGTLGLYYIATGNRNEAHNALTIVKRIDPKSAYALNIGDMLGIPREDDPNFASFFKLLKKERNKVRMVTK